jgi:DNA repair exonuclease SbcCD ATPase subunit
MTASRTPPPTASTEELSEAFKALNERLGMIQKDVEVVTNIAKRLGAIPTTIGDVTTITTRLEAVQKNVEKLKGSRNLPQLVSGSVAGLLGLFAIGFGLRLGSTKQEFNALPMVIIFMTTGLLLTALTAMVLSQPNKGVDKVLADIQDAKSDEKNRTAEIERQAKELKLDVLQLAGSIDGKFKAVLAQKEVLLDKLPVIQDATTKLTTLDGDIQALKKQIEEMQKQNADIGDWLKAKLP